MVIFAIYEVVAPSSENRGGESIVITGPKIEQLAAVFAKTWQRPPTPPELKALIDDTVKEEIYVREALALGLDKDDTVIRRRLRQKMEFMGDIGADALAPTNAELQAFLDAHSAKFALEPSIAFQQVLLGPDHHKDRMEQDAAVVLASLRSTPAPDPSQLGDASLLPADMPLTESDDDRPDIWFRICRGPWQDTKRPMDGTDRVGLRPACRAHPGRKDGRRPALAEVRNAVARDWSSERRRQIKEARLGALLSATV